MSVALKNDEKKPPPEWIDGFRVGFWWGLCVAVLGSVALLFLEGF